MSSPPIRPQRAQRDREDEGVDTKGTVSQPKVPEATLADIRTALDGAIASKRLAAFEDVFATADKEDSGKVTRRQFENGLRDQLKVGGGREGRGRGMAVELP